VPIYLKYGRIEGGVTASGLKGWIALESFQWGVAGTPSAAGGPPHLNVSDITIGKVEDKASVPLLAELVLGRPTNGVMVKFYKTFKSFQKLYLQFSLDNTLVSSYSLNAEGGSGNAQPSESLNLSFTKMEIQSPGQTPVGIIVPPPG
jgi:type VI secretion system secreted protein Hcp